MQRTFLATIVATIFAHQAVALANTSDQLEQISVVETDLSDTLVNTHVNRKSIELEQPKDLKDLFRNKMDVYVSQLNGSRSGGEGVNIRGLQANRVTTTVDGIPLPEAQEAKHFISYGSEYGRGDYVEVTGLRSADVQYAGSANSLSGSVNFATLEPYDILKGRNFAGFVGTGYDSVDNSVYGTTGVAIKEGAYQSMVMSTIRNGNETENRGSNSSTGTLRTEPNPADYKSVYVLTKHQYQVDANNKVKFTFENQRKRTDTNLLTLTGTSIDSGTGIQQSGSSTDIVRRSRFSLEHEYSNDKGWVQSAKTQIYLQNASTQNARYRLGSRNYRAEDSEVKHKTYGITTDWTSYIDGQIPQVLRYGLAFNQIKAENYLHYERPGYNACMVQVRGRCMMYYSSVGKAYFDGKPTADTTQTKITGYLEDEIAFGNVIVTPQIGFIHYRVTPEANDNVLADFQAEKQKETQFTPKLSIEWQITPEFEPYVQYSRGVRTPSPQQLTSYFYENPMGYAVAVVGNPNLKAETADNFELGFKGKTDEFEYLITGYYNRYKNFIDWKTRDIPSYTSFIQYANLDKAKVYGFTADARWNFYRDFYTTASLAYARGKANDNGIETPINSIQPLKAKLGLGYAGDNFGAHVQWTYNRGKADKDIDQSSAYLYNPTGGYSVFDLGMYWKPVKDLTLTANVNNIFDKKYWNWNDISYLALLSKATNDQGRPASSIPMAITSANADRYTAPGRNFNVGVRYEF